MKILHKFILISICSTILVSNSVFSQNKKDTMRYNESVIVLGDYEPILSDAFKINRNPTLFDTVPRLLKFDYNILSKRYPTSFIPDAIKPAKIMGEPISRLYKNYAKIGLGTYLTPLAEFYYNSVRSRNTLYGMYFNHFSSWQSLQDYANSSFSNTDLNIFGKYFWQESALSGEVFYANNYYHYYGFKEENISPVLGKEDINSDTYSQFYNRFGIKALYQSLYANDNKLHHSIGINLSDVIGRYKSNELNFQLNFDANKKFELFNKQKQTLGLNVIWDLDRTKINPSEHPATTDLYSSYLNGNDTIKTLSALTFYPYFRFMLYDFNFDVGFNASFAFTDETNIYLYPYAKASLNLMDKQLTLYGGISGKLRKNTLETLRMQNSYILDNVEIGYTNNKLNIFAGIKSSPVKQLDVQLEVMYSRLNNAPMFILDTFFVLQNVYKAIYDDVNLLKIGAQLSYSLHEKLNLGLGGNFYSANPEHQTEYWYNPSFDLNMGIKYLIADKITVDLTTKFVSKIPGFQYLDGIFTKETLKGRIDLNLAVNYHYSKSLTFFWLLNNIANQRYYEWTNYPTQKFNTMLGLTYSFR